ncbi:hypothetical protein EV03_2291 [Prochlorococcus marinus str. PAC1]|uniref:Uncharacterized protein n=1 Tax=Prochlorococcus marinus str. PAC1 TaxID=59924 RepID=A0A0A2C0K8_PROMR|nr:hypothetical protein EV03_2291 [Prochlorococcus marinus str. PAC1]
MKNSKLFFYHYIYILKINYKLYKVEIKYIDKYKKEYSLALDDSMTTLFKRIWTGVLISLIVHQFINH